MRLTPQEWGFRAPIPRGSGVTAGRYRGRLPPHRSARRGPPLPSHQPALRARLHRARYQQSLQAVAHNLQRRQHHYLSRPRPPSPPRRDRPCRRLKLPSERPREDLKTPHRASLRVHSLRHRLSNHRSSRFSRLRSQIHTAILALLPHVAAESASALDPLRFEDGG
jgi:hypothetical protein